MNGGDVAVRAGSAMDDGPVECPAGWVAELPGGPDTAANNVGHMRDLAT